MDTNVWVENQDGGVEMERIRNGRYTKEFREEAVKMATEGGVPVLEISKRLSLPKSTLENCGETEDLCRPGNRHQLAFLRARAFIVSSNSVAGSLSQACPYWLSPTHFR